MSNLRLIIFSDLHYTDEEQNWETKRKLVEQAEPILEKLIEKGYKNNKQGGICNGNKSNAKKSKKFIFIRNASNVINFRYYYSIVIYSTYE